MKEPLPLVSIVVPVFNRSEFILECLSSALSQTYANVEIIVYDNHSTDGTWEILKQVSLREPKVRIFRQEKNVGPVNNWYAALSKASGSFVKILFSDDVIYP